MTEQEMHDLLDDIEVADLGLADLVLEDKPEHGSSDWLAARHRDSEGRARLTASVAGAILGEHEYVKPADLALQMLKDEPPSEEMTEEMQRGHDLEPVLLNAWSREYGSDVERPEHMFVRGRWLANLDGVSWDLNAPVEAKSTTHHFRDERFGQAPFLYWKWQGIAQRMVFSGGPGYVYWAIIDPDLRWKFFEQFVEADEIAQLHAASEEWLSYIDLGMPPLGVELNASHVAALNQGAAGAIDLPADALLWTRRLAAARAMKKQAEVDEEECRDWLARHLAGKDVGLVDGVEIVTWKEQAGRMGFDAKSFAADHPELHEKYKRRGSPFRVLRLKGEPA